MQRDPSGPPPPAPAPIRRVLSGVALLSLAVAAHLNVWLWNSDRLVLGFPVNLLYHLVLTLVLCIAMVVLVRRRWPSYLDDEDRQ